MKKILGKNTHLSLDEGEDRQLWGKLQYKGVYKFHPLVNIEPEQKFNVMWELIWFVVGIFKYTKNKKLLL